MKLERILNFLYSQEQNVVVESFWDAGWTFSLNSGDSPDRATFDSLSEGADWLLGAWLGKTGYLSAKQRREAWETWDRENAP